METLSDGRTGRGKAGLIIILPLLVFLAFFGVFFYAFPMLPAAGAKDHDRQRGGESVVDLQGFNAADYLPFLSNVKCKGTMIMRSRISLEGAFRGSLPVTAEIILQGIVAARGDLRVDLRGRDLKLSVEGLYDVAGDRIDIRALQADLSETGLLNVRGTLSRIGTGSPVMDLTAEGRISVGELRDILSGPAVKWLQDLDMDADGDVSLFITGPVKSPRIAGNLKVQGERLNGKNVSVRGYRAEIPFLYAEGSFNVRNLMLRAKEVLSMPVSGTDRPWFRLDNADARIPAMEYSGAFIKSEIMEVRIDRAGAGAGDQVLHEEQGVVITASGAYDSPSRKATFTSISLNSNFLKNITGHAAVDLNDKLTVNARIHYDDFPLEEILRRLAPHFPGVGESGVRGSGSIRVALNISMPEQGESRVAVSLETDIRDAGFSSHDETVIAEGVAAEVTGTAGFSLPFGNIDFAVNSRAWGFELLAGLFYGNFAKKSLDMSARGKYSASTNVLSLQEAALDLTDTGRVVLTGDVTGLGERPRFRGEVSLKDVSNREGYNFLIRETFREKYPFLAGIEVDGESAVKLSVDWTLDSFTAVGSVTMDRVNVRGKETGRFVHDLNMSLPVSLYRGVATPVPSEENFGFLRVQNVSWGALVTGGIEVFPAVRANTLLFRDDISIPVFEGTVALKNVSYADLLSPARKLSLAVEVNRVDLDQVTGALEIPRFSGDLSGTIPSAAFAENRLVTEGEIQLSLFDGSMRVTGLSMDRVFSPIPSLTCSIDVEDIDLAQLTSTFDFGHISGVIRGSIQDLVIVRGQAQSFKVSLESVRKKGVSQKISVEALKKISILGSGTSASILDRGIYQLFKEYRYAKLGFRGVLRNDNLRLLGIETRDGKGYLVRGGIFPPRVDVINYNQDISFNELVRRLKRVSQAGRQ